MEWSIYARWVWGHTPTENFIFWAFSVARRQSFNEWMNTYLFCLLRCTLVLVSVFWSGLLESHTFRRWGLRTEGCRTARNHYASFNFVPVCFRCPNIHRTTALMGNNRQFTSDGKSGSVDTGLTRPEAWPCYKGTSIDLVTCWYNESRLIFCTIRTSVTNIHRKSFCILVDVVLCTHLWV